MPSRLVLLAMHYEKVSSLIWSNTNNQHVLSIAIVTGRVESVGGKSPMQLRHRDGLVFTNLHSPTQPREWSN